MFFDISKAFDNVWHKGLIFKLINARIPNYIIYYIQNFLNNRKFYIKIDNSRSDLYNIEAGVPQGAVLSPILFNIFINDIPLENSKNKSYSLLFADDLTTFFIFRKTGNLEKIINKYLQKIEKWLALWRLKLNVKKSNYTVFCASKNYSLRLNLKVSNQLLPYNRYPKLLGIILDERLNFTKQIQFLKRKCLERLNIIKII